MILEREFDRIFSLIALLSSGKIEASKLLEEWKLFLERLGKELPEASTEEREEIQEGLRKLSTIINHSVAKLAKEMQLGPGQLKAFVENPNNFKSEDWLFLQQNKAETSSLTSEIKPFISSPESQVPKKQLLQKKKGKGLKRQKWLRP